MCTGDNLDTAIAISRNAGIVTDAQLGESKYTAMTGKEFREEVGGLIKVPNPDKKDKEINAVKDMNMVLFNLLNFFGAALLTISLTVNYNLPTLVLEIVWMGIALFGLARAFRERRKAAKKGDGAA